MDCLGTNGESFHTETQFSLNVRVQEFGTRTPISSSNFYACNSDVIRSVEFKIKKRLGDLHFAKRMKSH